jgi:hypothetical protein
VIFITAKLKVEAEHADVPPFLVETPKSSARRSSRDDWSELGEMRVD